MAATPEKHKVEGMYSVLFTFDAKFHMLQEVFQVHEDERSRIFFAKCRYSLYPISESIFHIRLHGKEHLPFKEVLRALLGFLSSSQLPEQRTEPRSEDSCTAGPSETLQHSVQAPEAAEPHHGGPESEGNVH